MNKKLFTTTFFIFFVLSPFVVVGARDFVVNFVIPESPYYFLPSLDSTIFSDSGNNTINLTIYLKQTEFPYDSHLNNSASVSGNITDNYGNLTSVVFNNTGSNGSYFLDYDFPYNGTYTLKIAILNESFGYSVLQSNLYVGTYNLSLIINLSQSTFFAGQTGLLSLFVEDDYGFYQEGGNATVNIIYSDGSFWSYNYMTDNGDGEYFKVFSAPGTIGNYTLLVNFTLGDNVGSINTSFVVEQTPVTAGGGSGSFTDIPLYIYVKIPEGNTIQAGKIKAYITLVNLGGREKTDVIIYYYLEDPDGVIHNKKLEIIEYVNTGETVIERELDLPKNAITGEWKFHAAHILPDETEITAMTVFRIYNSQLWITIVIIALLLIFIIYRERKRNKDAERTVKENYVIEREEQKKKRKRKK